MARTSVLFALTCAALAVGATVPAGAAAQGPCAAPTVDSFLVPPNVRAGDAAEFGVNDTGSASTIVDWGDGTSSPQGQTTVEHTYAKAGQYRVVATATSACGARVAGATTVRVYPACATATDVSVAYDDCVGARAELRVFAGPRRTRATPLSVGACAETGVVAPVPAEPVPVPVARAACSYAPRQGPPPVHGRVRAFRGKTLTLRLGAPATRVSVALGAAARRQTDYVKAVKADALGKVWTIRLSTRRNAATRVYVLVARPRVSGEHFVAGIRVV